MTYAWSRFEADGKFKLPFPVLNRLTDLLRPWKTAGERAFKLARFLARYHSLHQGRLFPMDRRALAKDHPELGLSERQIRSAIELLELVGYIERVPAAGPTHKRNGHRKAIQWQFTRLFDGWFSFVRRLLPKMRMNNNITLLKEKGDKITNLFLGTGQEPTLTEATETSSHPPSRPSMKSGTATAEMA